MMIVYVCLHNLRLVYKNSRILLLFILSPLFLIFILGTSLDEVFAQNPQGPRAIDYFGRNFLGIALLYGSLLSGWVVSKERSGKTNLRLAVSPVGMHLSLGGLFVSGWLAIFSLTGITALSGFLLLGMRIDGSLPVQLLMLAGGSFFSAAAGVFFASLFKDPNGSLGALSGVIPVFIFLGGGYFPLPQSGILKTLSVISPLSWIFDSLYRTQDTVLVIATLGILIVPGMVCIAGAWVILARRGRI